MPDERAPSEQPLGVVPQHDEYFELPDDYDDLLAAGRAALEALPLDDDRERTRAVLANAPSRADVETAARAMAAAQETLRAMEESRYVGTDSDRLATVTIDLGGSVRGLEFDVGLVNTGARTAAAAVLAAWLAAEDARAAGGGRFGGTSSAGVTE